MGGYGVGFQLTFVTAPLLKSLEHIGAPIDFVEALCDTVSGAVDGPHVIDPRQQRWFEQIKQRYPLIAHSNYGEEYSFRPAS